MIEFKAHSGGVKIDQHGQLKVTFIVPQIEAPKAFGLGLLTDVVFNVKVEPEVKDRNSDIG